MGDFVVQNREAARYARWAAMAAGTIALVVAGVYVQHTIRESRLPHSQAPSVPESVERQSQEFSYSGGEGNRTVFTVRASHATQFKDQNSYLLQNVWITIYGREGNRNDNIHTHECSYLPTTGDMRCQGDAQIDIENPNPTPSKSGDHAVHITTRNLSFNRGTGMASTTEPVAFHFPNGEGRAVGATYNTQKSLVRLEHSVQLDIASSDRTNGLPVNATGSSLEIQRDERIVQLFGPASVHQGGRELSAGKITIHLDADFHAQTAIAEGQPTIRSDDSRGQMTVSADAITAFLNTSGWVDRIVAESHVEGTRKSASGTDHLLSGQVELAMAQQNQIQSMTASHGVKLNSTLKSDVRILTTDSLRVKFAPGKQPGSTHVVSAETLSPGIIEMKNGVDTTDIRAKKFVTQFDSNGNIQKLLGHSGTEISRQIGSGIPQVSTATELAATFGASEEWDTLDESGDVRFHQGDRQGSAAHALMVRATDTIELDGSPVMFDSTSRTTAGSFSINQKSGEMRGKGGITSTYVPSAQAHAANAINLGTGAAHISANALSGSTTSGHVIYSGDARLWQGESVLDANQIEIWRDDKKLQATGNVVAIFPQTSGPSAKVPVKSPKPSSLMALEKPSGPIVWEIHAPKLTYWDDAGKAHLEDGVTANSQQGFLQSRTLDVYLATGPKSVVSAESPSAKPATPVESRQLDRALALGGVIVRQADRRGTAEQAEYTAADGKFVLSGGNPTLTDASSDTTTGHSLTFFVANDTILIDSQKGLRTLTKHRVEK
jgi:lipopolysaccharide export system protein LptA